MIQNLSPRERLLIGSLGAIALVLIPLKAFDWRENASTAAQEAQVELTAAQMAARTGAATAVNRKIALQRKQIRAWAWTAPTRPIGRVLLENQIATLALQAGMKPVDVKSFDTLQTVGGLDFIQVEVNTTFDWVTLTKFLSGVAATGKGVVVETISEPDETPPKVRIVLRLPLAPPPGGGAPPPRQAVA